MPGPDWLFDEQGRMRKDLPPLLHPYGQGNALAMPPPQPNGLGDPTELLDRLGLELAPDGMGGWRVTPKRWGNPGGAPFNGLMLKRDFNLLAGGRR